MAERSSLREGLLQLEPLEGPGRAACEQALQQLFARKLSRGERWRYLLPACAGLVMALGLSSLALTEPTTTPLWTRILLLVLAGLGALWFLICWRVLRRGSIDLETDRRRTANTALGASLLQVGIFGWQAHVDPQHAQGLTVALAFLVVAAVVFVAQRLHESEARLREDFLRLRLGLPPATERR